MWHFVAPIRIGMRLAVKRDLHPFSRHPYEDMTKLNFLHNDALHTLTVRLLTNSNPHTGLMLYSRGKNIHTYNKVKMLQVLLWSTNSDVRVHLKFPLI